MYFRYFVIISPWKRVGPFIWRNINLLHQRMLCAKFGWNWPSGSGEEDIKILSMYFRYFVIISPWKMVGLFIWTNLNPLHQRMLCAKFGWNWPSGSGEDFLISSTYFRYFVIISPWKRAGSFIWTNLNPLHPRMLCAKFGWNWPSGSGEEDILISSMYFRYFEIISPWKRAGSFIWTNLNPLHPRMFCAKFNWNWPSGSEEEEFLISSMYFRYFVIISPWKRVGPFIRKNWVPFNKGCIVPRLAEIGPVVLEKNTCIFKICQCIFAVS